MQSNERRLIRDLFDRLAAAEIQRRDPEVERLIASEMQRVPHAAYAMAQTIIAQNQALEAAAARIEALETGREDEDGRERAAPGAMGAPDVGRRGTVPSIRRGAEPGGFLANAGQIALGVAGGMLLGEAAKSLLAAGSEAQASPAALDAGAQGEPTASGDVGAEQGAETGGGGFFDWLFGGGGEAANDHGPHMADSDWDFGGWDGGE